MKIRFNVTGANRKPLVKAVSEITGAESRYLGAPSFGYAVDYFTIDREGTLLFDDRADTEEIENLLEELAQRGFIGEREDADASANENDTADAKGEVTENSAADANEIAEPEDENENKDASADKEPAPEKCASEKESAPDAELAAIKEANDEARAEDASDSTQTEDVDACENIPAKIDAGTGLTISMPRTSFSADALQNLRALIASKAGLIKKAIGINALPIEETEERVSFPWFSITPDSSDAKAYMDFIAALCREARTRKRVTAKERDVANEKYTFRCFLLRLGFIGNEYKESRRVLLRNLSGNGAFLSGKRKEAASDAVSE